MQRGPGVDAARVQRHAGVEQPRHDLVVAGAGPARQVLLVVVGEHELGVLRPHAGGVLVLAAHDRSDELRGRVELGARTRRREQLHRGRVLEAGGAHVRRPPVAVARVERGAVLDQQLHDLGVAGVQERVAQLRVRRAQVALLEQHAQLRRVLDRVAERVGVAHRGTAREQQLQAGAVLGLDGVVDGLAIVRVRSAVEQQPRRLEVVGDAGGAVQHRHRAVLVVVHLVHVGAAIEQQLDHAAHAGRARRRRAQEDGVAGARQRLASRARQVAGDEARVAVERGRHDALVAEHQRHVELRPGERRIVREQPLGDVVAAAERGGDEPRAPLRAIPARRLHVAHQRGPGLEAEVGGDGALGVRQPRGAVVAHPRERVGVAGTGGAQQLLRAAARLVEVELHHDLLLALVLAARAPESIASVAGSCLMGDGPRALSASRARSPGRAAREL